MNIGIVGSNGYLGETLKSFFSLSHKIVPLKLRIDNNSDLVNFNLKSMIDMHKLDVIVNCAAIIGFINCYKNAKKAYFVNSILPHLICSVCKNLNVKYYHISTEAVFPSGDLNSLYSETDIPNPETVYGKSKYIGEQTIINFNNSTIIRLPRLFGWGSQIVYNLYQKIQNNEKIKVSTDLFSTPVHIILVAEEILKIIEKNKISKYGKIFHITGDTLLSLYDLIRKTVPKNKLIYLDKGVSDIFNKDSEEALLLNCGLLSLNKLTVSLDHSINKFLKKE